MGFALSLRISLQFSLLAYRGSLQKRHGPPRSTLACADWEAWVVGVPSCWRRWDVIGSLRSNPLPET